MKKQIIFLFFFYAIVGFSQIPTVVSAPILEAEASKNLTQTIQLLSTGKENLSEAKKTVNFLDKSLKALKYVNDKLFDIVKTYDIVNKQSESVLRITYIIENFDKKFIHFPSNRKRDVLDALRTVLREVAKQAALTKKLFTSGILNMNDADRLKFLDDMYEKVNKTNYKVSLFQNELTDIDYHYRVLKQ